MRSNEIVGCDRKKDWLAGWLGGERASRVEQRERERMSERWRSIDGELLFCSLALASTSLIDRLIDILIDHGPSSQAIQEA